MVAESPRVIVRDPCPATGLPCATPLAGCGTLWCARKPDITEPMTDAVLTHARRRLMRAIEGVIDMDWTGNDDDAVEAIETLRRAYADMTTVDRLADGSTVGASVPERPAEPLSGNALLAAEALAQARRAPGCGATYGLSPAAAHPVQAPPRAPTEAMIDEGQNTAHRIGHNLRAAKIIDIWIAMYDEGMKR